MNDPAGDDKQQRQQRVTDFGTRLAVVKGYVQLLNRHVDRADIPRDQLVRYCRVLDAHLVLLEDAARELVESDGDHVIGPIAFRLGRGEDGDKDSSASS